VDNLSILSNDVPTAAPPPPAPKRPQNSQTYSNVKVLDFEMSFSKMVWFMVKFSFATIPAALIIVTFWVLGVAILRWL
jgi:hypothetical protein